MAAIERRTLLGAAGAALVAACAGEAAADTPPRRTDAGLDLRDYQPRSMLHAAETKVPRAKFPVIDIHTHLSFSQKSAKGVSFGEERRFLEPPQELLSVMDRRNIRMLVNLTGGVGSGLREGVARYD